MLYDAERRTTWMRQRGVEYSDVGKHGDPRMVFHAGLGDSIWNGEMKKKWQEQGKTVVGV